MRERCLSGSKPGTLGDCCPAISPDGATIAFRRALANELDQLFLLPAKGTGPWGERRLTTQSLGQRRHDWTPDGRALVASVQLKGSMRSLYVISVDGSPIRLLMPTSIAASQPAVARRGNRLAWVASLEDMNLWLMDRTPHPVQSAGQGPTSCSARYRATPGPALRRRRTEMDWGNRRRARVARLVARKQLGYFPKCVAR